MTQSDSTVSYGSIYDSSDGSWLMRFNTSELSVRKLTPGGNMQTYFSTTGAIRGIALNKVTASPAHEYFYYCDNSTSPAKIKKADMINSPSSSAALVWPISSIDCAGNNMIYSASRDSLIFIYKQNGFYGIIEYPNP